MEKKTKVIIFSLLALGFLAIAVRYTFFYIETCETSECFLNNLASCSRAVFINEQTEATWKYKIKSLSSEECRIEVTMLQQKTTDPDMISLEGKTMTCYMEKGVVNYPEKYLDKCHGILKEEMQSLMIKKLHAYLLENLGEIKSGLEEF